MGPLTSPAPLGTAEALHQLAERLVERLGLPLACILVPDGGGLAGPCAGPRHDPSNRPAIEGIRPLLRRVLESGQPALDADAAALLGEPLPLAVLPLAGPGHPPAGCLVAVGARRWSTAEIAALESTAAAAAAELRRRGEAEQHAASDRRLRLLEQALELVPLGVTIADSEGRIVYTNPAEASMHGYRVDELYGRSARSLAPRELWSPGSGTARRVRGWVRERTNLRSDGTPFPVRLWSDPVLEGDREVGLVTACADLSEWRETEAELVQREVAFRSIVEHALEFIVRFDEGGRVVYLNPAALASFGLTPERATGRTLAELAAAGVELPWADALQRVLGGEEESSGEGELRTAGGGVWLRYRALRERARGGSSVLVFACDITEHRQREHRLIRDAERDPLTGLLNREAFLRQLELASLGAAGGFALLFLDLDRFKSVNDSLGHGVGDAVLAAVAERLRSAVRPVDLVGRLGGDEFAVLVEGAERESDAVSVVERVQRLMEAPVHASGHELRISASIGIALAGGGDSADGVLRSADRAMYRAKSMGPGHYGILDSELVLHEEAVLDARKDLRLAIERDQLVLHYQPIVSLLDGRLMAMEALVRWQHPQRGLLGPQAFLPIAEQTGLIVELDRWVLRRAAAQVAEWAGRGLPVAGAPVSVNFSGRHIVRRDAADFVEGLVAELGIEPGTLMIEVTETSVMDDRDVAAAALSRLRRMGIRICLDDFGTGYSSLAYLRHFPFDVLKIDRSFVQRIDSSQADRAIVRSILALAGTLGLEVTAEGVETARQRAVLRRLGCRQAQGFLISEPVEAAAAERWFPVAR